MGVGGDWHGLAIEPEGTRRRLGRSKKGGLLANYQRFKKNYG